MEPTNTNPPINTDPPTNPAPPAYPSTPAAPDTGSKGHPTAALVLGILSIVMFAVWFISIILGIVAVCLGIIANNKQHSGKAIAGIVTGGIGIALSVLAISLVFLAVPSLQKNSRDTARKNDVSIIASNVSEYMSKNSGQLPVASDLSAIRLTTVTSVNSEGEPTTTAAVYRVGTGCGGAVSERAYSVTVMLESGATYCAGS